MRVGGVCVRGMSFSHAKCGKLYHKVPPNHLSNTEESKQELCMFIKFQVWERKQIFFGRRTHPKCLIEVQFSLQNINMQRQL